MLLNKKELKKIFREKGKQISPQAIELIERIVRDKIYRMIISCRFKRFTVEDVEV